MKNLKGIFTAIVTPFINEKIDIQSFEKLLKEQIRLGIDGFVINGTTGESPTISFEERNLLFSVAKKVCGDEKVLIMGTGTNDTKKTIEASQAAEKLGADALLVVVPYYNKPPQRGLYQHFKKIAESVELPIILYNVPGRTITSLEIETIKELSKIKNIVGIKEATGNIEFAKKIIEACGPNFIMLSGDDGTYVEFLKAGGHGVISVTSHVVPEKMVLWKKQVDGGNYETAAKDLQVYKQLFDMLFVEANPIPVKKALSLMKLIETAEMRLPLFEMDPALANKMQLEMKNLGLLK